MGAQTTEREIKGRFDKLLNVNLPIKFDIWERICRFFITKSEVVWRNSGDLNTGPFWYSNGKKVVWLLHGLVLKCNLNIWINLVWHSDHHLSSLHWSILGFLLFLFIQSRMCLLRPLHIVPSALTQLRLTSLYSFISCWAKKWEKKTGNFYLLKTSPPHFCALMLSGPVNEISHYPLKGYSF